MSEEALKDFLRNQAQSLDSLLELTPAKHMFSEDVSDQWKRKKQTPEQKKAARMAKLDPDNWKSAKDVYDERNAEATKKRKREQEGDEGLVEAAQEQTSKKQKTDATKNAAPKPKPTEKLTEVIDADLLGNRNLKKKMKKRAHRAEKNQQKREEKEKRKEAKQTGTTNMNDQPQVNSPEQTKATKKAERQRQRAERLPIPSQTQDNAQKLATTSGRVDKEHVEGDENEKGEGSDAEEADGAWSDVEEQQSELQADMPDVEDDDIAGEDQDEDMEDAASTATSSEGVPEILSPPQDSAASSVSSIVPPPKTVTQKAAQTTKPDSASEAAKSSDTVQTNEEREAARQRLQEQISQFRSQRKADDKPARSRAELLAQRRKKEEERKVAKKEQRRKEKEEEAKKQDEEMARRFSPGGSGSLLASPRSPMIDDGGSNAFTFGRIAFGDGTQFDAASGEAAEGKKRKGPADPATALKAAQAKQARIAGLDDGKKHSIEEKDMWLNAKKRAHGERVKDDTSLLKKALKRQDKSKQKSGKEWDKRVEGIRSSQEAKQKKRTENLNKRRDEKKSGSGDGSGSKKKTVKRPGFEGSFRGRSGKSKKS